MLLFSRLIGQLQKEISPLRYECGEDSVLSELLFLGAENEVFRTGVLYTAFGDRVISRQRFPHDMILVCRDDAERSTLEAYLATVDGPRNLIFATDQQYANVFNITQNALVKAQRDSERYTEFLKMIVSGRDLSFLLTEGAKQCGRQLIALDFSGKILATSPTRDYLTTDWVDALKNGYCPADFMQHLYDKLLTRVKITNRPFIYLCEETGLTYLSSPVLLNGTAAGYVFLLSKTAEFDQVAYEILPVLSRVVADYLKASNPDYSDGNQFFFGLVRDILRGAAPDAARSRIATLKLPVPQTMRVLVVRSYYYEKEKEILKNLSPQLSLVFGSLAPIRYENSLIILQNMGPGQEEQNAKAMTFLEGLAASNQLYIGISNVFSQFDELAEHYGEATEALKLAGKLNLQKNLICYSEVAFYSMLWKVPNSEKMRTFCHPALEKLQKYDVENGTSLLKTLDVYLKTNCNQKLTAEILYTHRNTVNYRRQQIVELTGIDFQNSDTLFQLQYSFKIYRFFGL